MLVVKKAVSLEAWSGPDGSRKLRFPDFLTTAKDGGKDVSLTHQQLLRPGHSPGTHIPQGYIAIRRIYCKEKFHDTIWDCGQRPSDL
jgi:hypothetical protein